MADKEKTTPTTPETPVESSKSKTKRRLKPAPQSIREQSEIATAKANGPTQRSLIRKIVRFPFLVIFWPFRMLFRYVIKPVGRFLNRFKFFRIIGYIFVPPYFRSAWKELRLVTWPNARETFDLVVAVLIFSFIFGVMIAAVDYGLDKLFRSVILNK